MKKIEYPLNETEKERIRKRLDEVLNQTKGEQVIILWDKDTLTDYYQNICIKHLLEKIKDTAIEFSVLTNNKFINNDLEPMKRKIDCTVITGDRTIEVKK